MKKMLSAGNQIHIFISSSGSGTVINYGSGSDFLTSYGSCYGSFSGAGSTSQNFTGSYGFGSTTLFRIIVPPPPLHPASVSSWYTLAGR